MLPRGPAVTSAWLAQWMASWSIGKKIVRSQELNFYRLPAYPWPVTPQFLMSTPSMACPARRAM